jgi:DNA-binding CsgD family transcriptional regulator
MSGDGAAPRGPETGAVGAGEERLPLDLLTLALGLALWVASGSLAIALASDAGAHPTRRVVIGVVLVLVSACALWRRAAVSAALRKRPWLVVPLAAAQFTAAAVDGLLAGGPYVAFSVTSIAVAVIVASPRTVWLCVALLDLGYAAVVLSSQSPAALVRDGRLDSVLGGLLGYPFVALVLLGLTGLFAAFLANLAPSLDALRGGAPSLTPALTRAVLGGADRPPALPAPAARLTPAERSVVAGLAHGSAPKELAYSWGISLATVRTHIKRAKRKTGARTLAELVALAAPQEVDRSRTARPSVVGSASQIPWPRRW